MEEIYRFSGNKILSKLTTKNDYDRMEKSLFDDDYFDIPLIKKSDYIRAKESGCSIYCKTFEFDRYKTERYFIRVPKDATFKYSQR